MILDFPISIEGASQSFQIESPLSSLGDGYDQLNLPCGRSIMESWDLQTPALPKVNTDSLVSTLRSLEGDVPFQWRFFPTDEYQSYHCDTWDEMPLGNGLWQVSLKISRSDQWEIDECLIRPVDDAVDHPIIPLSLFYGSNQSYQAKVLGERINGGVDARGSFGMNAVTNSWNVRAPLNAEDSKALLTFLADRCGSSFEFRLVPSEKGQVYSCLQWSRKYLGEGWWEFSAEFKQNVQPFRKSDVLQIKEMFDFYSEREAIVAVMQQTFADIDEKLDGIYEWMMRHSRALYPFMFSPQELLPNAFHSVLGRGGYFPPSAGVSEGQALIVRALMLAYFATGNVKWLNKAVICGEAMLEYFYPLKINPGWQPSDGIRNPHWLINIKAAFVAKGLPAPNPLNMGHFDLVVNFVNGEGFIPYGAPHYGELLSNIFRVYPVGDRLLWKSVYARPLGGFFWTVDYWVTDQMLEGVVKRQFADTESNNGRDPIPTDEPLGKIKLATPYTGQAKVAYMTYTGGIIPVGGLFEAYPGWRGLRYHEAMAALDVFPWWHQAATWLYQATGNPRWQEVIACNMFTFEQARNVINPTAWYQKSDSLEPFAYPGSQAILANYSPTQEITASRFTTPGEKLNWLRMDIPTSPLQYPSAELQNFAVAAKINPETTIFVEAACSASTELEVILSLSKDAFDFSQYYTARLPVIGSNTPVGRVFSTREFLLWDKTKTSWHPYNADNPVYTYNGLGGTVAIARTTQTISTIPRSVWQINLDRNNGFAGAGLVMIDVLPKFPLQIFLKHEGSGEARLAVTVAEVKYYRTLAKGDWQLLRLPASVFENDDGKTPSGFITNIEIEASNQETITWIWWAGGEPKELPAPIQTYKAALVSRVTTAHTLWVGTFEAIGSPSSYLKYTPGVVPYTCNVVSNGIGGQIIDAWQGTVILIGYQDLEFEVERGDWVAVNNILDLFLDSQRAYYEQSNSKTYGFFVPGYVWPMWSSGEYTSNGEFDVFTFNTIDPNNSWSPYAFRAIKSCARAWRRMVDGDFPGIAPSNLSTLISKAEKVTMDFLNALSANYIKRRSVTAITDFRQNIDPQVLYTEPHASALIADTALHANIAGGTKYAAVTLRVLKAAYNHMQKEYVSTGVMAGSFTASQPSFIGADGLTYKQSFGFWCGEQVFFMADFKLLKHRINFPKCVYFVRP